MFPEDFIAAVSQGDAGIRKALANLDQVTETFAASFEGEPSEVAGCSVLSAGESDIASHVANHVGLTQWLLGRRMCDQLVDFVSALQTHRVFAAALLGRAVIETSAACIYWEERLKVPLGQSARDLLDDLHLMSAGGRFDWIAMREGTPAREVLKLYGKGKDPEVPQERRAPNVVTMLDKLDRRLAPDGEAGVVRAVYSMLSDFCHPAVGTALVLTEPSARRGFIRLKGAPGIKETRWFFWNLGTIIGPVAVSALGSLRALAARHAQPTEVA